MYSICESIGNSTETNCYEIIPNLIIKDIIIYIRSYFNHMIK